MSKRSNSNDELTAHLTDTAYSDHQDQEGAGAADDDDNNNSSNNNNSNNNNDNDNNNDGDQGNQDKTGAGIAASGVAAGFLDFTAAAAATTTTTLTTATTVTSSTTTTTTTTVPVGGGGVGSATRALVASTTSAAAAVVIAAIDAGSLSSLLLSASPGAGPSCCRQSDPGSTAAAAATVTTASATTLGDSADSGDLGGGTRRVRGGGGGGSRERGTVQDAGIVIDGAGDIGAAGGEEGFRAADHHRIIDDIDPHRSIDDIDHPHRTIDVRRSATMSSSTSSWKVVVYAAGILISYAVFGIFQEKILRGRFGEHHERFTFQFSLILIQCAMNTLMAKVLLHTLWKQGSDPTHTRYYVVSSVFYLVAMLTSFWALKYVNYPTQVVAKSCKPIPVMILGVLLARKRYTLLKYVFVLLIVAGIALFMYKDNVAAATAGRTATGGGGDDDDNNAALYGNVLLCVSLTLDGLLGAVQDRMRQNFQTRSLHMMYRINLLSVGYVALGLLYTGELPAFVGFVQRFPELYGDIALFAVSSAVGQIFIYSTVAEFGPLVCSIVTTTRKFFTVIGSVLLFGNALTDRQWLGTTLVFAGLFLDAFYGKSSPCCKKA